MAARKKQINILFALLAIVLVGTSIWSAIRTEKPMVRTDTEPGRADASMPEDHPPLDMVQKLTELIRRSEEDPGNAAIHTNIGNIYYDLKEYEKAVQSYRKSLEIQPADPYVETDLATCLHYLGRDDEALERFDHVLKHTPDFPQALYNKGIVLIQSKNDVEGGIKAWEKLLQTDLDPARRAELQRDIQQLKSSAP
jgi:tetratricopeptide (TPR) repeat protein